jgi:hypothetical protein
MKNTCKCGAKLYLRNGIPVNKLCVTCRKVKLQSKTDKHKTTTVFRDKMIKKLTKENDKIFQDICRLKFKTCYWNHPYSCAHHWVRKAQSLYLRYDFNNVIPVCMSCHCKIHQAQDSTLEAEFVLAQGRSWFSEMLERKREIVTDKLVFLENMNGILKGELEKYGSK